MSHFVSAGSLLFSIDLESLDPRDSHDLLCVLRHYQAPATWATKRIDHAWLYTVHNTVNQEIGLRWNSSTAHQQIESSASIGMPVTALVIDRISKIKSFHLPPESNAVGLWIDTSSVRDRLRPCKVVPVARQVCQVPVSCDLPKMASIWTSRLVRTIYRSISDGQSIHLLIHGQDEKGPAIATRLDRILKTHAMHVRSISKVARAAIQSRLSKPSRSILQGAA